MLTLKTKTARFEWIDDDVESVVTLSSEDDQETLVRKLKRVIALVEDEPTPTLFAAQAAGVPPNTLRKGLPEAPPRPGNSWKAYAPPEVPERLKGEVELIPPEENA